MFRLYLLLALVYSFVLIFKIASCEKDFRSHTSNENRQNYFLGWLTGVINFRPIRMTTTTPITTTTTKMGIVPQIGCSLKCACGVPNQRHRIVGGHETNINQYPWVAMMMYSGKFYCGATLLNDRYVATAGHCISGFNSNNVIIRFLSHDKANPSMDKIDRKVKAVITHSRYNLSTYNNDIALILLDQPIQMSDTMKPVCLPTPRKSFTGEIGIAMGWGATKEYGIPSNTLQEVMVPIMANSECKRSNYNPDRITENMICAGYKDGKKDSCQGDSGGPLHVINESNGRFELVGIVSWGEGCAEPNFPGVYTRLNRYLTWTRSNSPDGCYCQ